MKTARDCVNSVIISGVCESISDITPLERDGHCCNLNILVDNERGGSFELPHQVSFYGSLALVAVGKIRPGDRLTIQGGLFPKLDQNRRYIMRVIGFKFLLSPHESRS